MAEANIFQDKFSCSVCLDLLRDPVTVPCGHSYCMDCITSCWNQDDQTGIYSCPQCRQTFTPRPALNKNVMIAEMMEELKKTRLQSAVSAPLVDSYCQNHLQHYLFKDMRHHLQDPTAKLNVMICPRHNKQMEIYCRTDQQCICYLCMMDEHKDHDVAAAVGERIEKQRVLRETQRNFKQIIQEKEMKLQELREAVKSYKRSAQTAVEDSERIFTELIRSIERRRSEVTQLIRDREKTEVSQTEEVLKRLEQEIDDLKRRNTELEQLSHTDNHISFLQSFQSLSAPPECTNSHRITLRSLLFFDDVTKSVSQLKRKLEDICREETEKISNKGYIGYITTVPEGSKTRKEFLQYIKQFRLDSNTVNEDLYLSDGNTKATNSGTVFSYPKHPVRFDCWPQVLCRESVCGRCYWEVEWSVNAGISVSYKSISRNGWGNECAFGFNNLSWTLHCTDSICIFWHNNNHTDLPVVSSSCRIGVYVDHSAGTLSFYSVSDTMTLIHRVQTTFTQPLYPGFIVSKGSTVKVCRLTKQIRFYI